MRLLDPSLQVLIYNLNNGYLGGGGGFRQCLYAIFSILMVGYNGPRLLSNRNNRWLGRGKRGRRSAEGERNLYSIR